MASAQDMDSEQGADALKPAAPAVSRYETRRIEGSVRDAATGQPIGGAIVSADGVEGYSILTADDGSYTLDVPVFASAVRVQCPDYNLLLLGLTRDAAQKTGFLIPSSFKGDYQAELNLLNDRTASDLQYSSAANIKEEVQKQLGAYAYGVSRSGSPGLGHVLFVQGLNSLNANAQPLVVVDGVILEQQYNREGLHQGFFNDILTGINPADIEDMTIMRNGTALYGARGANGVLLITTKRSKSMATRITARVSAGVAMEPKYISMMGAEQYRNYASELLKGTGTKITDFKFLNSDPDYYYYKQYHNETDWKDQVYRTAITQNYGIAVEGGDDIAQYSLSVGYTSSESNLCYNEMDRLSIRFNTDINLTKKLSTRFDASFSNTKRNLRDDGAPLSYDDGTPSAPSFLAYAKAPFLSPYSYGNGQLSKTYFDISDESYLDEALANYPSYNYKLGNPYSFNQYAEAENKNHFENSLLNIAVTPKYRFTQNLSLSGQFSYTLVNSNIKYFIPMNGVPDYYVASVSGIRQNEVRSQASKQNSIQSDIRLEWKQRFEAHDVKVFGGTRINWETFSRNSQLGYNTGSDKTPFMSAALMNAASYGDKDEWRNMDVYAQANYNYAGRYYAQLNLTGSGSSRFGKDAAGGLKFGGVVWAIFPSVQASWVLTNESWFADVPGLDYLRLTAGYDISGNDGIGNDAARSYFATQNFLNAISGKSFEGIGNTQIKWETTRRINAGLEANFLRNRLHVGGNFFHGETSNLLSLQTLGFLTGLEENWTNGGKLQNTGFDVTLSGKMLATRHWSWELGASVGHYKNEIKALASGQKPYNTEVNNATIRTEVGQAANLFYGYRTQGVFATTEQASEAGLYQMAANGIDRQYFGAGDMIFVDRDNNHEINEADREVIGDPNPDFYGNLFTSLSYKRLRLDINFNYSVGNDIYNYMRSQLEGGSRFMNQTTALTQRWQAEGQTTSIPKASFQDPMGNSRFSDRWIEDGSYLRLKSVTLSYDLPLNMQFLQGLQFWIQGNNLLTLTKYLGSDPEVASGSMVIGQGIDLGLVGQSPSVVAGIKINL